MNRLACCQPTGQDGASQTVVHGPLCELPCDGLHLGPCKRLVKAGHALSPAEYAEWLGHPVASKPPHLRVVTTSVTTSRKRKPRRRPEKWDVGFRDPAFDEELR